MSFRTLLMAVNTTARAGFTANDLALNDIISGASLNSSSNADTTSLVNHHLAQVGSNVQIDFADAGVPTLHTGNG